jgi:nucleotide-binding universal stress UspA family protein
MSFGRLLEVGAPEELYQRPQTEFVASFLGVANLMVGTATHTSVQLGGVQFPMQNGYQPSRTDLRVQVLFRPEDVALVSEAGELDCPNLGQACVEEVSFGGSIERLRLRLPPIPGVRHISPPVPFGGESLLVEATRPPDQASRFSLQPGDRAWIGVRRIHALTHPGLSILIATDGSLRSQAAITLGGGIARLANARVTLLGCGGRGEAFERYLQEARKQIGGGLASLEVCSPVEPSLTGINQVIERQPYDLVILGFDPSEHLALAEGILQNGDHHLLLVTGPHSLPTHALVCVSSGEPGKDDVLFAGRLIRHLCADATLLTILDGGDSRDPYRAERFLAGGVKSLSLLGVTASPEIRTGDPGEEILAALKAGGYDLLIMGTPLANSTGEISFNGLIGNVLKNISSVPVLIVRSHFIGARHPAARHKDFPLVSE